MKRLAFGRTAPSAPRVAQLATTHDVDEIAEIFQVPVEEIKPLMPKAVKKPYELVNLAKAGKHEPGDRWPVHSPRKGYLLAQLMGLVEHETVRVR